ncbi:MAG: hypothetical protein WC928_01440 [Patescibacteria group bacterium]|jgi:hypothetical protein
MFDFIKTILLVAIFYVLILFSFMWFNKEKRDYQSIPYIQGVFQLVDNLSEWVGNNTVDKIRIKEIFKKENRDIDNLLPAGSEGWDDFLKEE